MVLRRTVGFFHEIIWIKNHFEPSKGDAIALGSRFIIWTCLFGVIFLKEKLHCVDMLIIPVTIGGVILIARPPFIFGGHDYDENTLSGIFYSLISAVSIAGLYICLRKISNDVHYTIASFYYSIIGFFLIGLIIWTTTGFNLICQVNLRRTVQNLRYQWLNLTAWELWFRFRMNCRLFYGWV